MGAAPHSYGPVTQMEDRGHEVGKKVKLSFVIIHTVVQSESLCRRKVRHAHVTCAVQWK